MSRVLAIDLGGTRIKAGLLVDGSLVEQRIAPAPADGSREAVLAAIDGVASGWSVEAAGLCVPGLVDEDGIVASLPGKHAGIEGLDLPEVLRDVVGVERAVVVNDAIAYATGEAVRGAGAGARRVVVVTIGTGVGVTVIDRGAPVTRGLVGGGILGGFIPISASTEPPLDSNGTAGTIEALCSARQLAERCGLERVEDAYAAIAAGDAAARSGLATYREDLVRALVALAHAHAPDRIVLGGGPITSDNPITPGLEERVAQRLFAGYRVELRIAALGDAAALFGLAQLVEAP